MLSRRTLPDGITIDQIAAALAAITTARISLSATVRKKGRDFPAHGDGLVDASRGAMSTSIAADGRQTEQLTVGRDSFQRLPASQQQATGKLWLWNPVPHHDFWPQVIAAMPHIASCTGSSAEILSGEPVRRCSFLLKPQRTLLAKLGKRSDPSVAELYAALRDQGRPDRDPRDLAAESGRPTPGHPRDHRSNPANRRRQGSGKTTLLPRLFGCVPGAPGVPAAAHLWVSRQFRFSSAG